MDSVAAPGLEFVCEFNVQIATPLELGAAEEITHRYVANIGGRVAGPRFNGRVVPGGGDTQRIHSNGVTEILARYLWQADDGAIIQVVNKGLRRVAPDVLKRV